MLLDALLKHLSRRVGVVVTGRNFLLQVDVAGAEPVVLPNRWMVPPEPVWPHLSPEVREAMLVPALQQPIAAPVVREGQWENFRAAETVLGEGIRRTLAGHSLIKPAVVATARLVGTTQKRAVIDSLERAGARKVFLVDYPVACGLGMGLPVAETPVSGVLSLESDWFTFAAIRYGDQVVSVSGSLGFDHLLLDLRGHVQDAHGVLVAPGDLAQLLAARGLDAEGVLTGQPLDEDARPTALLAPGEVRAAARPWLYRLTDALQQSLSLLTPEQWGSLATQGIHLCGDGLAIPGLGTALRDRLGIPVTDHRGSPHPALTGIVKYYLSYAGAWRRMRRLERAVR